jgi:hypothetical protein
MSPRNVALAVIAVALLAGSLYAATARSRPAKPIEQPLAFSHKKHTAAESDRSPKLACTECHVGAEKSAIASLPSIDRCLECHMRAQSDRAEEKMVRALASSSSPGFRQVTRNAGHVHFSHSAHVSVAGLSCAQCHGDVTTWTAPPTKPDPRLMNMGACIDCHRQRGASTQCQVCHK